MANIDWIGLLEDIETAKDKLEGVIRDLKSEMKALKNKVEFLEKERQNLQSQSESQTQLQDSQVAALEAVSCSKYFYINLFPFFFKRSNLLTLSCDIILIYTVRGEL